jgi:hypothetical protein
MTEQIKELIGVFSEKEKEKNRNEKQISNKKNFFNNRLRWLLTPPPVHVIIGDDFKKKHFFDSKSIITGGH